MYSIRWSYRSVYLCLLILSIIFVISCSGGSGTESTTGSTGGTPGSDNYSGDFSSTDGQDITLQWDESVDAPYLKSYKVYYYTAPNNPQSLMQGDYAAAYSLADGTGIQLSTSSPKAITIDKKNTQITLHFSNKKTYYFVVTAVDTRGLESVPTPEVTSG